MKLRITGYDGKTDGAIITRPRTLAGAARRLRRDGKNWRRWGWDDIMLEVNDGTGWRSLYRDEVPTDLGNDLRCELMGQATPRTEWVKE